MPSISMRKDNSLEAINEVKAQLDALQQQIENNQIRLESLLSTAIEREMITQDSFDKMYNLLTEFGKKKGWIKKE